MIQKKELKYATNETYGPEALPIVNFLNGKFNVSEFVIAKKTDTEIHKVRQILYKLSEESIVIFIRKKDKEKGWYICYWSLNEEEIVYIIQKIKKKKLNKLKDRLNQETTQDYYMCKNACTRMNFDEAFELNFKCPDCGEIMNRQSNERTVEFLKKRIKELEKEIENPKDPVIETKNKEEKKKKLIKEKKPRKKKKKSKKKKK